MYTNPNCRKRMDNHSPKINNEHVELTGTTHYDSNIFIWKEHFAVTVSVPQILCSNFNDTIHTK